MSSQHTAPSGAGPVIGAPEATTQHGSPREQSTNSAAVGATDRADESRFSTEDIADADARYVADTSADVTRRVGAVDAEKSPTHALPNCSPVRTKSLGEMLRAAREARGLRTETVVDRIRERRGPYIDTIPSPCDALWESEHGATLCVPEILGALHSFEPLSPQERDAILCRAGIVPPDLAALILANPERLDAARKVLGDDCTCDPDEDGGHADGCVALFRRSAK